MRLSLALAISLALAGCGHAAGPESRIVLGRVGAPRTEARIVVATHAIGPDGAIGYSFTEYGNNVTLPVGWSAVRDVGAYALVVEDPDAPSPRPFVHWLVWNIPAGVTAVPEGQPQTPLLTALRNADQGRNDGDGEAGYYGPHPPAGGGQHHYHIQVFALDGPLSLPAGSDRDALVAAMRGHVLADGETVGTFTAPMPPQP